jgi:class 3 adenylate cyclase
MGENEEATFQTLASHRKITDRLIQQHHGRFVNAAGDSGLAEFARVVEAMNCAVEIQRRLRNENAELPLERRMEFRIGVNRVLRQIRLVGSARALKVASSEPLLWDVDAN